MQEKNSLGVSVHLLSRDVYIIYYGSTTKPLELENILKDASILLHRLSGFLHLTANPKHTFTVYLELEFHIF